MYVIRKVYFLVLKTFIFLLITTTAFSQPHHKLHIANIETPNPVKTTWYGRPLAANYLISWELYAVSEDKQPKRLNTYEIPQYRLFCSAGDSAFQNKAVMWDTLLAGKDQFLFVNKKVGPRYYFRIDGMKNGEVVVQSDTAWVVSGKPRMMAAYSPEEETVKKSFPIPLFFPLANILEKVFGYQNEIYAHSTIFGKFAFTLIWWFGIFGLLYVLPFRCFTSFRLGVIFPFEKFSWRKSKIHFLNLERNYEDRISPKFRFVLEAWKSVVSHTNRLVREGEQENMEEVEKTCYTHFKTHGAGAIETLIQIINYDPAKTDTAGEGNSEQPAKEELIQKVEKYFGDEEFTDIVNKPVQITTPYRKISLQWEDVKNDIFNQDAKRMNNYPTVKILSGGLENHLINGFRWQTVSEEVDRAMENRAGAEIESIKRKSLLDWFWNLGALSPLLGLFGTVTGITEAFRRIKDLKEGTSHLELVSKLSGGIFEALWTTVLGLVVGILLMILYYYYKNKLDWIYGKWQSIYVHVTEKL